MGLLLAAAGVRAQEQDDTARRLDSLQRVVTELTSNVQTLETEDLNQAIWKDRAKYFNIGYVNQTMTDKTFGGELKSDFGVSLSNGKTYYLHKKPLFGMVKIGLDWSTDTYDGGAHLNVSGAEKLTSYFGAILRETFGLEDHRADAELSALWQEKCNAYEAEKNGGTS